MKKNQMSKAASKSSNATILLKTAQAGSDFVGIKITQNEREIVFPMGYHLEKTEIDTSKVEKQERAQILNLIKSVSRCASFKKGQIISKLNGKTASDFPVRAMLYIIEDFLDRNSYYTEKENLYTKDSGGKISWARTVKKIKPVISVSGIAFLNFIVRKNRIQENRLITELHKYCVYKSFEIFGFLYSPVLPEKGLLQESDVVKNRKDYAKFLQEKIDSTHLESSLELFSNMLDIVNNFDSEDETKEASYGTESFQVVWESLVDSVFGTVSQQQKKKYFCPSTKWIFADETKPRINAPLRPDTIMILDKTCFIIDSKYYSYSMLKKSHFEEDGEDDEMESVLFHGSIPGSDSIQKQITYAQHIDRSVKNSSCHPKVPEIFRFAPENIWNVFILPEDNAGEKIKYIGKATTSWNDGSKNYHTVHAATLDTKFLLENYEKNKEQLRAKLAEVVQVKTE